MKLRADSWAGNFNQEQVEKAFLIASKATPRHAAIPEIVKAFGLPSAPSKTAFYNWLAVVEKDSWRWRLKHAVQVARTMEAALPDEADALYRNSLVALGMDAAVQNDPKFAIAIGKTLNAMNRAREERLQQQIEELKTTILNLQAAAQTANAPLAPERLADAIDEVLGRKKTAPNKEKAP